MSSTVTRNQLELETRAETGARLPLLYLQLLLGVNQCTGEDELSGVLRRLAEP